MKYTQLVKLLLIGMLVAGGIVSAGCAKSAPAIQVQAMPAIPVQPVNLPPS